MFDTLEEQIDRTEDPAEKKNKWMWFATACLITLAVFGILGWAMWRYQ